MEIDHTISMDSNLYGVSKNGAENRIGFLLIPSFSLLACVSAVEPLRAANRMASRPLYSWHFISADGRPVLASNGMLQQVGAGLESSCNVSKLIVCGPFEPNLYRHAGVFKWLHHMAQKGIPLGALETGSYVLARAGLMHGYRSAIHWENYQGFVTEFPDITVSREIFVVDRQRFTSAGGTAAMDMMLDQIQRKYGRELTARIADLCVQDRIRSADAPQRLNVRLRTGISNAVMLNCIELMEGNIDQPLTAQECADLCGVSKRQLERLFQRYLNTTPSSYYMGLRLRCGRDLLEQTSLPIIQIALACGFTSAGHFSHRFRSIFGKPPRMTRIRDGEARHRRPVSGADWH